MPRSEREPWMTAEEAPLDQPVQSGEADPECVPQLEDVVEEISERASVATGKVDTEPGERVSFAEAVEILRGKLDLKVALDDAIQSHDRWGLDTSGYGTLFNGVTINKTDLLIICGMIERGEKVLPIFDAGAMTPDELFAVLFTKGGVLHYNVSYGFKHLAEVRRINPKDLPNLANLAGRSSEEQLAAFKSAYAKADPMKPTGARVSFTPDKRKVIGAGTSATQDMQAFAKGEMSFIDLNADLLRYRAQMDEGLRKIAMSRKVDFDSMDGIAYRAFLEQAFVNKTIHEYMPDCRRMTRYPNYVFICGGVPTLGFDIGNSKVLINYCNPCNASDNVGSRISFG